MPRSLSSARNCQACERSLEALFSEHERKKLRHSWDPLNSSRRAVRAFISAPQCPGRTGRELRRACCLEGYRLLPVRCLRGEGGTLSPPAHAHGCTLCMHHLSFAHSYAALALHQGVHCLVHAPACSHARLPGWAVSAHRLASRRLESGEKVCAGCLPSP